MPIFLSARVVRGLPLNEKLPTVDVGREDVRGMCVKKSEYIKNAIDY